MRVTVRRKVVDATYFSPAVPSTYKSAFAVVGAGVRVVQPNALPGLWHLAKSGPMPRRFVVLGAGKTAMDACIWLLQSGTPAEAITWVVPRDSWIVNRLGTQNGLEFFKEAIGGQADQMQTFTEAEVAELRRIRNVMRLGRAIAIDTDAMRLERGGVAVEPGTLFIDCPASTVRFKAPPPVFHGRKIVVQLLRAPPAALTAYVEAHKTGGATRCRSRAPPPNTRA